MDIKRYVELKAKGSITLQKVATEVEVVIRKWDRETGEELDPDIMPIDEASFESQKEESQLVVDGIDTFLADVAAVK